MTDSRHSRRLGLKWSVDNGSQAFRRLLNESQQIQDIETWVNATRSLGWEYYFPIVFMMLTGLRPSEACMSLSILSKEGCGNYYNGELGVLEHFRFDSFLRRTKNCYITFVSKETLEKALAYGETTSWNKLRLKVYRSGLKVRFSDLRKTWATTLHENGIPQESVDLLQGRVSRNVFTRFYYRPNLEALGEKVLQILEPLEQRLLSEDRDSDASNDRAGLKVLT